MKPHVHQKYQRRSKTRIIIFSVIVFVVLSAASYLLASAFAPRTPPPADNVVDLTASMSGFNVDTVRLKVGQAVTVRLTSLDGPHHTDGGGRHQWAVDELGVSVIAPSMGSDSVTFTPDKPGVYTYYCDICCGGRANPSMQGRLIVEA